MKPHQKDRIFFLTITTYIVVICFLGFSRSFYLRDSTLPSLATYTIVHGIVTSLWMLIFLFQSILLNTKNYKKLHFRIGWAGLVALILMVVSGFFVVFLSGQDYDKSVEHTGDSTMHLLLVLSLGLTGIALRKKPPAHKRLMVFASMIMSSAAVARLNFFGFAVGPYYYIYYLIVFIPLFAILVYDLWVYRKVFKVTIISTVVIYLCMFHSLFIWQSKVWSDIVYSITPLKTPDQTVFHEDEPELLFDGGAGSFLEGPVMSKEGLLFFTMFRRDSLGENHSYVMQFDLATSETSTVFQADGIFNGMAFDPNGNQIVCDPKNHSVKKLNLSMGTTETIADRYQGSPFDEPNDIAIDASGNIYFTDPIFVKKAEPVQSRRGVYKINANREVTLISSKAKNPNGLILSPDGGVLYVADSPYHPNSTTQKGGAILRYLNWKDAGFMLLDKLVEYDGEGPDGLALDQKGNLYVALFDGKRVEVHHPNGRLIDQLAFPDTHPTNVTFGVDEYQNTLFITTETRLYSIKTR